MTSIAPSRTSIAFSCPHCGALAHQSWFQLYGKPHDGPVGPIDPLEVQAYLNDPNHSREQKVAILEFNNRVVVGEVFLRAKSDTIYGAQCVENLFLTRCFSCGGEAAWIHDHVVYPRSNSAGLVPNSDLNIDIQEDFREAASILELSHRGSAALLRLCVQKLLVQVGQPGKNINDEIAALVRGGLSPTIQKSLDIVRVVGNNAVHPGVIDLKDDRATAMNLFGLLNLIAETLISIPKKIDATYASVVPPATQIAIAKRDSTA